MKGIVPVLWMCLAGITSVQAQTAPPAVEAPSPQTAQMTLAKLVELVKKIDPAATVQGAAVRFKVEDRALILVADEKAGRMRIMAPVATAEGLDAATLHRMLQANFDAVLDARYAIANGLVWSAFIHPLPPLDAAQLLQAVTQVYLAAETFGTTYMSGALIFGGGDSNAEHKALREKLKRRLESHI